MSSTSLSSSLLRKIPASKLAVSEPSPFMFGNNKNDTDNPKWSNKNWLKSRFHFSFAEYDNPANQSFGVLRVMNDDLVQPRRGFGEHPHRDMEICTYVVEGSLTHGDSMGTEETLHRGAIQYMTAGKGVFHSEYNESDVPLRFIQIWINTRTRGLKPNYGSFCGDDGARHNAWAHVVSDVRSDLSSDVKINQDANIFVSEIDPGVEIDFQLNEGRMAYCICVEGASTFTDTLTGGNIELAKHDAVELFGPCALRVSGGSHILMVEMKFEYDAGRKDI